MSLKSIQLYNIAVWHLEQADLADRLFILSHWAR